MKEKTTILQMYYGQRGDSDKIEATPEYWSYRDAATECYEKLREKLEQTPELWQLFLKYDENLDNANLLDIASHYEEGFKFGLLIGIEAGESKFKE